MTCSCASASSKLAADDVRRDRHRPSPNVRYKVYARNYGSGLKWIAGVVTRKIGNVMYEIRTEKGLIRKHLSQLRMRTSKCEPVLSDGCTSWGLFVDCIGRPTGTKNEQENVGGDNFVVRRSTRIRRAPIRLDL